VNNSHSDALVFFGATGDLAYKKIFPALQALSLSDQPDTQTQSSSLLKSWPTRSLGLEWAVGLQPNL
jgi:glucose-6-phosphate 1-dehydrogenase